MRSQSCDMLDHIETDFQKSLDASCQIIISRQFSMSHPLISRTRCFQTKNALKRIFHVTPTDIWNYPHTSRITRRVILCKSFLNNPIPSAGRLSSFLTRNESNWNERIILKYKGSASPKQDLPHPSIIHIRFS